MILTYLGYAHLQTFLEIHDEKEPYSAKNKQTTKHLPNFAQIYQSSKNELAAK